MTRRVLFFVLFVGSFLAIFGGRLWYGYKVVPDEPRVIGSRARVPSVDADELAARRNFARDGASVYEMIAEITSSSREFDKDARKLRAALSRIGGATQFERSIVRSDKTTRAIVISYAVSPDLFTRAFEAVREIGKVESSNITRTDRTAQYTRLASEAEALEASDRALLELRRARGTIEEMSELQRRILDVERQLHDARARIAPFERDELCTIRVTFYEDADVTIPPPSKHHRMMVAFKWAVKYWLAFLIGLFLFSIAAFLLFVIFAKLADITSPRGRHIRAYDAIRAIPAASPTPDDEKEKIGIEEKVEKEEKGETEDKEEKE